MQKGSDLRQDIASCLFIVADVLNRLFIIDEEQEAKEDDSEYEDVAHMRRRPHRRKDTRLEVLEQVESLFSFLFQRPLLACLEIVL